MPAIGKQALADAVAAAKGFLAKVKASVESRKQKDRLEILAKESYDGAAYAARLALAGKAQKILNRVAVAVREGRLDANALDRDVLRQVVGEAVADWRADMLLQNLLRTAYNAGRYTQQMADDSRGFLLYRSMRDSRVRPSHAKLDGVLLPKGDPFWTTHYPPNDHRCRCRVDSLTAKQAAALAKSSRRIKTRAPEEATISSVDKITGETVKTPESVAAGWAGPPDISAERLAKLLERQIALLQKI